MPRSLIVTGSGSKMVKDLTPARAMFFAAKKSVSAGVKVSGGHSPISIPRPSKPMINTLEADIRFIAVD